MLRKMLFTSFMVGLGAVVVTALPDIARYMKMRQM
ncbi:MAG: hypothetical protein QOC93_2053 [Actinomycetota bacterium]|jgi:hypothetical protein|nr:hypothetical protein [Cryptosporangiaceae bacterium]MDQ1676909.1 hypothetical protein [Actinomycetota bacterium]